jgi:NADPH-dependent 2,4-dienoyl-CoA reductase/sulfur reductase-like enzyme
MRIKSPVGEFPMTVERVGLEDRRVVVRGAMGAWPTEVRLESTDLRDLASALPRRLVIAAGATALALALLARR